MSMIEVKKDFTRRELLCFGPLFGLFVGVLAYLAIPNVTTRYVVWGVGAVVIAIYYAIPSLQRSFYRGWIYAVMPIGWVISHVLLASIYYLILTPIGIAMRVCGYDPMHRRFDREAKSYWIARDSSPRSDRYFKQY